MNGDKEKCLSIIQSVDWSATDYRYRLAAFVLEEKFDEACELMKSIGSSKDMMNAYREWPLFTNFRETDVFKNTYKEIYKTEFDYIEVQSLEWEDVIKEAINFINIKNNSNESETVNFNEELFENS